MSVDVKRAANIAVQRALRRGELVRPDACERCGRADEPLQGHHPNYAEALRVEWLCAHCHADAHGGGLMRSTMQATLIRSRRATLKQAIKEGRVDGVAVLEGAEEHEEVATGMKLEELLRSIHGIGRLTAAEIMYGLKIPPTARLYGLTDERRREVAGVVRRRVA